MFYSRMRETPFPYHIVKNLERPDVDRLTHRFFISCVNSRSSSIKVCNSKDTAVPVDRQANRGELTVDARKAQRIESGFSVPLAGLRFATYVSSE
jgi:hypothetical protein